MGLCSRCGTEMGGAKFCPECGLPQSLQGGAASTAEPGAFVPLTIGKKGKKPRKGKASSAPASSTVKPATVSPPAPSVPPARSVVASAASVAPAAKRSSSTGKTVLVVALCIVCGLAIACAGLMVSAYLNGSPSPVASTANVESGMANESTQGFSSTTTAKAAQTKLATAEEKESLQAVIAEAAALAETDYTIESYTALAEAIESARTTSSDEAALSRDVKAAAKRVESAKASLKEKVKPIELTGTGSSVMDLPAEMTSCLVVASYPGEGKFLVSTLGADGAVVDTLVDASGPYAGTTANGKAAGAPKRLSIVADGPWTVTLQSMADAPYAANGRQMFGDAVVRINPDRAAFLNFTNAGAGSFVVYGIKGASANLLVNEIGPYAGSAPNAGYRMLAVKSNGAWSVSW